MKNKPRVAPRTSAAEKPPKREISEADFRERLKNIAAWRKQRLAELRAKNSR